MKLAISNIAWPQEQDAAVERLMKDRSVSRLEIAPTRAWEKPGDVGMAEAVAYRQSVEARGFSLVAMQSLLFGTDGLTLFGEAGPREAMALYLEKTIQLAGWLGIGVLVFGSPKNRLRGSLSKAEADTVAVDFFRTLGPTAVANNTCLCIEPNPKAYGCDYVTTAREGIELVTKVNHPGFGLHLDAAGMTLAGDDVELAIKDAAELLRHFHVSAPDLASIAEDGRVEHEKIASALRDIEYGQIISIEMRARSDQNVENIAATLDRVQKLYRDV